MTRTQLNHSYPSTRAIIHQALRARKRWIIALRSGYFDPCRKYLRVEPPIIPTGFKFSALGVLCAITQVGEFCRRQRPNEEGTLPSWYRIFEVPLPNPIPTYRYLTPPKQVFRHLRIKDPTLFIPHEYIPEAYRKYFPSSTTIMEINNHLELPEDEIFPLIADILDEPPPNIFLG